MEFHISESSRCNDVIFSFLWHCVMVVVAAAMVVVAMLVLVLVVVAMGDYGNERINHLSVRWPIRSFVRIGQGG
jgi:hypothetical protein